MTVCLRLWLAVMALAAFGACDGQFSADGPVRPPGSSPRDVLDEPVFPAPSTRWARLSHEEWENAVQDLLRLDAPSGLSTAFRPDALPGDAVFDNPGGDFEVDGTLWSAYQVAAADLAQQVARDEILRARVVPDGASPDESGARAFIEEFGLRAHRRPLTTQEVDEYLALYRLAPTLTEPGVDSFVAGVEVLVEAMLQSPWFLYKAEISAEIVDEVIPLSDFEIASRLSFALWRTIPDAELLAAAGRGQLHTAEQVRAQAVRLLDDPRAEAVLLDYHRQMLGAEYLQGIQPSDLVFPDVPDDLARRAQAEMDMVLEAFLANPESGFRDLLTSTDTFVDAELARIYGLEGDYPTDELVPARLDPEQRRGIFTHVGFLASRATSAQPDPIHRGVFIAERMACIHIGAPPDDIPAVPAPMGRTNRETVEAHTEAPDSVCATCHAEIINPFGFAFEAYDAVGSFRTMDNNLPVDTSARVLLDGSGVEVADAVDLAEAMAASTGVHACYVEHWMQYLLGRTGADEDEALANRLALGSRAGTLSVRALLVEVVTSPAFLTRAPDEEETE